MDDVQGSYTLQTYEDIAWADFQAEHGENFVRVNTVYSYDYHMNGNYYYLYEWLAIDTTDSDEDGALDFMETLGVLGSNHHTYYSDVGNPDSDGDTLPDGVELGNIYLFGKFTDNNYLERYRRDVDGTITPCQDFHIFDFFRSILFSRSVAAVACIHSDPKMQDSDGDDSIDPIDATPMEENQLVNYIIVGVDDPHDISFTLQNCADWYEEFLNQNDMPSIRLNIESREELHLFWDNMRRVEGELNSWEVSAYEHYSGVDNLILVFHGIVGASVLNPYFADAYNKQDYIVNASYYASWGIENETHINAVEFCSCYSGYIDGWETQSYFDGLSTAAAVVGFGNVDSAYGFNGPNREVSVDGIGYAPFECDGYYRFFTTDDYDIYAPLSTYIGYEELSRDGVGIFMDPDTYMLHIIYYYYPLHSFESAGV